LRKNGAKQIKTPTQKQECIQLKKIELGKYLEQEVRQQSNEWTEYHKCRYEAY